MSHVRGVGLEADSVRSGPESVEGAGDGLRARSAGDRAEYRFEALPARSLAIAASDLGVEGTGSLDLLGGPDEPVYLTSDRRSGGFQVWPAEDEPDSRPYLYPDHVQARTGRIDAVMLGISRRAVQERARALVGREDHVLRFTGTAPGDPGMDQQWRETTRYVHAALQALAAGASHDLVHAGLTELVAVSLLGTFPNSAVSDADDAAGRAPGSAAVRRALQYIEDHLDQPVTSSDIAAAARMSTRGIDAAFRRHLDTTPARHLRDRRLAAARRALLDGDPSVDSVAAIATAWGFVHLGRFAATYRRTYGENPRATLLR